MKTGGQNLLTIIVILAILLTGAGALSYWLYTEKTALESEVATLTAEVALKEEEILALETNKAELEERLGIEQGRNDEFAEQIGEISGTVGVLDKLQKTDKEFLAKYSKVYFLNENYVPKDLALIDKDFWANKEKPMQIHTRIESKMDDLLNDAKDDGVDFLIASAYRSFGTQAELKANYRFTYGTTANNFSAEQGYSEHQLGTTVDLTTPEIGLGLSGFDTTEAFKWLEDNAYKYGFILSYPKGNTYYQYEPWHWRYVGVDLATDLHRDEKNFYNLSQTEINEYLVKFFD